MRPIFISLLIFFFAQHSQLPGQDDLFQSLSANEMVSVRVNEPKRLVRFVREQFSRIRKSKAYRKAEELVFDSKYSAFQRDEIERQDIGETFNKLLNGIAATSELVVVFEEVDEKLAAYCFLKIPEKDRADAFDAIQQLNGYLELWFDGRSYKRFEFPFGKKGGIEFGEQEEFLILGLGAAQPVDGDTLARFSTNSNKLVSSRKFKTVRNWLRSNPNRNQPDIEIFANPRMLKRFFPKYQSNWEEYKTREMPIIGATLNFESGDNDLVAISDIVVTFTQPRSGLGKVFETYVPIDNLPLVDLKIYELESEGHDSRKYFDAQTEVLATKDNPNRYLDTRQKIYDNYGLDYLKDVVERRQERHLIRILNPKKQSTELLVIDKVKDPEVAERYVRKILKNLNRRRPGKHREMIERSHPFGVVFTEREDLDTSDAYFFNSDWVVIGTKWSLLKTVAALENNERWGSAAKRTEQLVKVSGMDGKPFRIGMYSPISWLLQVNDLRYKRIFARQKVGEPEPEIRVYLESAEDLDAEVFAFLASSIANTLGTQAVVQSQKQDYMRLTVGTYQSPEMLFGKKFDLTLNNAWQQQTGRKMNGEKLAPRKN